MGGKIRANGTLAGIGSGGEGGEVKLLRFSGNAVLTCDANVSKFPVNASSIVISNASLMFITPRNRLFGVSPSNSNLFKLVILYESLTNQPQESLWKLNATFLQIGNLTIPQSNDWIFCVSDVGHNDCFPMRSSVVKSLIVSVPSVGNYSIRAFNNATSGFLETEEGVSILSVALNYSFFSKCHFVPDATATVAPSGSPSAEFHPSDKHKQTSPAVNPAAFEETAALFDSRKTVESPIALFSPPNRHGRTDIVRNSAAFEETSHASISMTGNNAERLSIGVIAAIAIASIVLLVILIVGMLLVWKRCGLKGERQWKWSENSPTRDSLKLAEVTLLNWESLLIGKRED
jgi:hypothetical protein